MSEIAFRVNGDAVSVLGDPMRRLTDVLRDDLGLTGTKVGCDAGDCGACTVRLDGDPVCACLVPLGQLAGRDVATVEGLADGRRELSPLQAAFLACGGAQCGICTPGMLMASAALLDAHPDPTEQRCSMGSAACSAGAPATARSWRRSMAAPARAGRRAVVDTGDRVGGRVRGWPGSTASTRSRAPRSSGRTRSRRMR